MCVKRHSNVGQQVPPPLLPDLCGLIVGIPDIVRSVHETKR